MKKIVYGILTMAMALCCVTACKGGDESSSSLESSITESTSSEETVTHIQFTQTEVELTVGSSVQLETIVTNPNILTFWKIRDGEGHIASVKDGVVTGLSEGTTICYATYRGQTVMCLIKVSAQVAQPQWSLSSPYAVNGLTLNEGDSFNPLISLKLGDEIVEDDSLAYEVADETVVTVNANGSFLAVGVGETTVTVTTSNSKDASITLTVKVVEGIVEYE